MPGFFCVHLADIMEAKASGPEGTFFGKADLVYPILMLETVCICDEAVGTPWSSILVVFMVLGFPSLGICGCLIFYALISAKLLEVHFIYFESVCFDLPLLTGICPS